MLVQVTLALALALAIALAPALTCASTGYMTKQPY